MKLTEKDIENLRNFARASAPFLDHVLVIEYGKADVHLVESYNLFDTLHPVASVKITSKSEA